MGDNRDFDSEYRNTYTPKELPKRQEREAQKMRKPLPFEGKSTYTDYRAYDPAELRYFVNDIEIGQ